MTAQAFGIGKVSWAEHLKAQQVANKDIRNALTAARNDMKSMIQSTITDTASGELRRQQLIIARGEIAKQNLALMEGAVGPGVQKATNQAIKAAEKAEIRIGQMFEGKMAVGDARQLAQSMTATAARNVEAMTARLQFNHRISAQVRKTEKLTEKWLNQALNTGLASGLSARELAAKVSSLIDPNVPGGVSYASMRMARTEINNAYHTVTVNHANAMPWTEGFKWELSGSHGSPDICDDLADDDVYGKGSGVYPKMWVPQKPHPQCLCYVLVVVEPFDQFAQKLVDGDYDSYLSGQLMQPQTKVGGLKQTPPIKPNKPLPKKSGSDIIKEMSAAASKKAGHQGPYLKSTAPIKKPAPVTRPKRPAPPPNTTPAAWKDNLNKFKRHASTAAQQTAEELTKGWRAFSELQRGALREYKGSSALINGQLRYPTSNQTMARSEMSRRQTAAQIDQLDTAMKASSGMSQDTVVYRGLRSDPGFRIGERFTDAGFGSTTINEGVARNFASGGPMVEIMVPKGAKGVWMEPKGMGLYREAEFLLPRGSEFEVLGRNPVNGRIIMRLVT